MLSSSSPFPRVDHTYVTKVPCSDETAPLWISALDFIVPNLYRRAFMDGVATVLHSLSGTIPKTVIDLYGKQVDLMDFVVVREGETVVAKAVHPEGRIRFIPHSELSTMTKFESSSFSVSGNASTAYLDNYDDIQWSSTETPST